ncbi:MAG: hypothetical protein EPN43_04975 [Jatrophihabitans sp.]|nr:MAG: hypothetical protein EPN43_04975 [Jatrophihabitans sp.]
MLVGHGSRDPRSAATLADLARRAGWLCRPEPVRLAFLELARPLLEDALADLRGEVTVVPLLLGRAYHASVDLPGRLLANGAAGRAITLADPLGPDPSLVGALAGHAHGLAGADGFVLLAAGSGDAAANARTAAVAAQVAAATGRPVRHAFVSCRPGPERAVTALRADGVRRPAVLPYFLAPGRLLDAGLERARAAGVAAAAPPLATHPSLAGLVRDRARGARPPAPALAAGVRD